jgi:hypothetical protein
MSKFLRLLSKSTGLNNKVSPSRIVHNVESGIGELSVAVNVDIGNEGQISRRDGITATGITDNIHSLFDGKNDSFYVSGTSLYALNSDYTSTFIVTGLSSSYKMSYCEVLEKTYYGNSRENGVIVDRTRSAWEVGSYVGPTTYKKFASPPIGHLLSLYRGRMYLVKDNVLWYSEPFAYGAFDLARSYIWFEQYINAVMAVEDGLFVSADKVYFLRGNTPTEMAQSTVSSYPVVGQTGVIVQGEELLDKSIIGKCALWTSQDGIFLGQGNGQVRNLTKDKLDLPPIGGGCAVFSNGAYLTLLKQ